MEIELLDVVREAIKLSGIEHIRCSDNGDVIRLRRRRRNVYLGKVGFGFREVQYEHTSHVLSDPVWERGLVPVEGGIDINFNAPDSVESFVAFLQRKFE